MKENIEYKILTQPSEAIFSLLDKTIYGTKGVKISHRDTKKKLTELFQPEFHTLWENNKLLAVSIYCKRSVMINAERVDSYYIRYFSVDSLYQGMGLGRFLTECSEGHYRKTIKNKTIFYAYIEDRNIKSSGVAKHFEMRSIGKFTTLFFSRFFPRLNEHCDKASVEELALINNRLKEQYKDYVTVNFNRIGYEENYYVYKENGEIVAGIQGVKTHWQLKSIPGIVGWLTCHVFPFIPIVNRIANGKKFLFVGFEGIYYQEDKLVELIKLMEHVLASNKVFKGFIYLDGKDEFILKLKKSNKLGLLNRIQKPPSISISNQALFFSEEDQKKMENKLKYISAYDVT